MVNGQGNKSHWPLALFNVTADMHENMDFTYEYIGNSNKCMLMHVTIIKTDFMN